MNTVTPVHEYRVQSTEHFVPPYSGIRTEYIETTRRILPTESIPIRSIITRYRRVPRIPFCISFIPLFPFLLLWSLWDGGGYTQ